MHSLNRPHTSQPTGHGFCFLQSQIPSLLKKLQMGNCIRSDLMFGNIQGNWVECMNASSISIMLRLNIVFQKASVHKAGIKAFPTVLLK